MRNFNDLDVLVVDDQEMMRSLLSRVLMDAGFTSVREAESGTAGLAHLRARPADLIFVDYAMPHLNGPAFVAAVRADTALGSPRIIMISGMTDPADHKAAREAGADMVLVKPVPPRALFAAIEEMLNQSAPRSI